MGSESFSQAIACGLQAGIRGRDQRKAIKTIALQFGKELSEGVLSALNTETRVAFHAPTKNPQNLSGLFAPLSTFTMDTASKSLSANVEGGNDWFEICQIDMNEESGYPCAVVYDGTRYCCSDESQLREELQKLARIRGTYIVESVEKRRGKKKK